MKITLNKESKIFNGLGVIKKILNRILFAIND